MVAQEMGTDGHATPRQRLRRELQRFFFMFLYLYLLLGVFVVIQSIVLRQQGIGFVAHGLALFNALVLAKFMLIGEDLRIGQRWFHDHPLIYPILFESAVFAVLFVLCHIAEEVIIGMIGGESFKASVPIIGGGGIIGLICVAFLFFVALVPYFGIHHLSLVLGPGRLNALLFHSRNALDDRA